MKREVMLVLTVLLFATCSYAACDITAAIDKGVSKSYTADGKDYAIKFSSLKNESGSLLVKFEVNDASTPELEKGDKHIFDDLSEITISEISKGSGSVNDSAQICFNAGLSGLKGTCSSNDDCEDNNPCTIDYCDGDPLRCRHKLILWCRDDDGCCPESRCTAENDNDCGKPILSGCANNSDCDDKNALTIDICENATKKCNNTLITKCISNDTLCPANCTFTSDTDCDECSEDKDCSDDNACTTDTCSGTPKRCFNNATPGCNFNGICVPPGARTGDKFCTKDNIMESLRQKKEYCDNNYECLSNICNKNKCRNTPLIKRISGWFKGLFNR